MGSTVTYSTESVVNDCFGTRGARDSAAVQHGVASGRNTKKAFGVNSQSPTTTPQLQQAPQVEPAASTVSPLLRFERSFRALRALRVVLVNEQVGRIASHSPGKPEL